MRYLVPIVFCVGATAPVFYRLDVERREKQRAEAVERRAEAEQLRQRHQADAERQAAWAEAKDEILSRLLSPGTANFGDQPNEQQLFQLSNGIWMFSGWVDATNRMGGTERIKVSTDRGPLRWQTTFTSPDGRCMIWSKEMPNGLQLNLTD